MPRSTTEEIIVKFRNVHGDRYNYSNVHYVNRTTNVSIICHKHGVFEQIPHVHLRGNGCSVCSRKKQRTTEEFLSDLKEVYGDEYDLSCTKYINANTKVKIICRVHGEFTQFPNNILRRHGCPECIRVSVRNKNSEEFLKRSKDIHGDEYDYSKVDYKNSYTNVEIVCGIHGSFFQQPRTHMNGGKCQKCSLHQKFVETG